MRRRALLGSLVALTALPQLASAQTAKLTSVRFISSPSDDLRPMLYAQSAGLFHQAGLDVVMERSSTGAVVAQSVIGGSMDVGKASLTSLVAGFARGLPFVLIAPSALYRKDHATSGIIVLKDSPLHGASDLQGKVVACTAIGDIAYLGLRALIDGAGGDSSAVKFVELPAATVPQAVQEGRIDAGLTTEPNLSASVRSGKFRLFVDMLEGYHSPILESAYFSNRSYVDANRDTVTRFAAVLERAARYSDTHEAQTLPLYESYANLDPAVTAQIHHSYTALTFEPSQIQPIVDLSAKYKLIPQRFDACQLMATTSG